MNTPTRPGPARRRNAGFTLIELLIVIAILGILSGVVVFAVGGINDRGEDSACDADRGTMEVAIEAYYAQEGTYPVAVTGTTAEQALVPGFLRRESTSYNVVSATGALAVDVANGSTCAL